MRVLLLLFVLCSTSLFAQQTVPEVQKPLLTKVTATWCPPCGSWGWDLFEGLVDDNSNSAVLIAGHYRGSDLETTAGNEIAENFGVSGQPSFFLGGDRQSATSGSVSMARTSIKSAIEAEAATAPVANAIIYATDLQDRVYTFTTQVEFFQQTTGEYSLAVYAVEDGVINRQSSRGNDAVHKNVLRGNIDGQGTFGEVLVNGAVSEGATYTTSFTFNFPATWNLNNVQLVPVIWNKEGASFTYVNANQLTSSDWQFVSSANQLVASDYRLTGFSESGILTTTLDLATSAEGVSLELIDASGRLLATRQLGIAPFGKTQIVWDEVSLQTGIYAVRLSVGNRSRTETVLVR